MKAPEKEVSHPFIMVCVPEVAAVLEEGQSKKISTEMELLVYKECVSVLEIILSMVEQQHCKLF